MNFNKTIKIGNHIIDENSATFIIAEAGVNHGGDISIAKQLIDVACRAGADAVKFQAFKTEALILQNVAKAPYQQQTTSKSESQFDMLKKLEITQAQNIELQRYCKEKNILFLTTPFDEQSLDELDELNLDAYKIASTDTTNLPFLEKVAKKGKPIFLSTGMSFFSEVELALKTIKMYNQDVVLLQCSANYPIQDNEAHLAVLNSYKKAFDMLLGYSDHTVGIGAAPFAIPMGVKVVEKHFTLDKTNSGPDHQASLCPEELIEFVQLVKRVDTYMGSSIKKPNLSELKTRESLQKSLVASCEIRQGEHFSAHNIIAKRTGGKGISPIYFDELLNCVATKNYKQDDIIEL
ncbi:MAG: N-acetylneuraminate synthase family protein [Candidatus Marinarcus sp.]|uniref:N-acetylneuraminate synthase family protein n=1 Tax=Candidatus Marinarcus sp. TaxID=3100987 RepID=UPI003B00B3C6